MSLRTPPGTDPRGPSISFFFLMESLSALRSLPGADSAPPPWPACLPISPVWRTIDFGAPSGLVSRVLLLQSDQFTVLLRSIHGGDKGAAEKLFAAVYDDLHQRADRMMVHQPAGHTLQPTAVIHEAWLRLGLDPDKDWQDRAHFLAVASKAMRSVLVDHARARRAQRRGGDHKRVEWDTAILEFETSAVDLLALDEALTRFAEFDPELSRLVELRFFGGLTIDETARVLECSTATVERGWRTARLWLRAELGERDRES